jgi:hypothetical protein
MRASTWLAYSFAPRRPVPVPRKARFAGGGWQDQALKSPFDSRSGPNNPGMKDLPAKNTRPAASHVLSCGAEATSN